MSQVEHQKDKNRFIINLGEHQAVLEYRLTGNTINFTSTYVPDSLRGNGYAEKLVKSGVEWAREQAFEMKASCWFARKYLA